MSRRQFGLVGKNISYSFSKKYFTDKFALGNLADCSYENFDIQTIEEFPTIIANNPDLVAKYFDMRWRFFFQTILRSKTGSPIGKIVDYFWQRYICGMRCVVKKLILH